MYEKKNNKMHEFYVIFPGKNYQNSRIFIFARKMPEFLHNNFRKIFFPFWGEVGGGVGC